MKAYFLADGPNFNISKLWSFSFCEYSCARQFHQDRKINSNIVLYSWPINIISGYNRIDLTIPISTPKGSMIFTSCANATGRIAIDTSGKSLYPDYYAVGQNAPISLFPINWFNNDRLMVNCLINGRYYESSILSIPHIFPSFGNFLMRQKFSDNAYPNSYDLSIKNSKFEIKHTYLSIELLIIC